MAARTLNNKTDDTFVWEIGKTYCTVGGLLATIIGNIGEDGHLVCLQRSGKVLTQESEDLFDSVFVCYGTELDDRVVAYLKGKACRFFNNPVRGLLELTGTEVKERVPQADFHRIVSTAVEIAIDGALHIPVREKEDCKTILEKVIINMLEPYV